MYRGVVRLWFLMDIVNKLFIWLVEDWIMSDRPSTASRVSSLYQTSKTGRRIPPSPRHRYTQSGTMKLSITLGVLVLLAITAFAQANGQ